MFTFMLNIENLVKLKDDNHRTVGFRRSISALMGTTELESLAECVKSSPPAIYARYFVLWFDQ